MALINTTIQNITSLEIMHTFFIKKAMYSQYILLQVYYYIWPQQFRSGLEC